MLPDDIEGLPIGASVASLRYELNAFLSEEGQVLSLEVRKPLEEMIEMLKETYAIAIDLYALISLELNGDKGSVKYKKEVIKSIRELVDFLECHGSAV